MVIGMALSKAYHLNEGMQILTETERSSADLNSTIDSGKESKCNCT